MCCFRGELTLGVHKIPFLEFSPLTRKLGLTIDSLIGADMVLADSSFVMVSAEEHSDLFWAIRGGGGNFVVVTSFLFRLHPVKTVLAGPTLWSLDKAADVMRWYREFIISAPENFEWVLRLPYCTALTLTPSASPFTADVRSGLVLRWTRRRV
jgi:FAD/FMN-containing dehydrogenase